MKTEYIRACSFWILVAGIVCSSQTAAAQDYFGSLSASGIYADGSKLLDDEEESNRSVFVLRGQGGARWVHRNSATRVAVSSNYYEYLDSERRDRWNNEVELGHEISLSKTVDLSILASVGSNYSTLEYRSADQVALGAEIIYRPSRKHRFGFAAEYRHREYDNPSESSGSAPYAEATYRYQPDNRHRFDFDARYEWTDTDNANFNYERQRVGGFYTRTFDRVNRLRVGAVLQNWEYDQRLVSGGGERLHSWRILPQVRFTRTFANEMSVELDYRRDFRRSNDVTREEDGNRLSLTVRKGF